MTERKVTESQHVADPGTMPPNVQPIILFCKKTDFMTNWPSRRVVMMHEGVQLGASPLTPYSQ